MREERLDCQRYWKDSWLVTLTWRQVTCQTLHHSLKDLQAGNPPAAAKQLQGRQAQENLQNPVLSHTAECERPVQARLGAIGTPGVQQIDLMSYNGKKIIFGRPAGANVNVMPFEASLKLSPLHGTCFSARLMLQWPEILSVIQELGVFLDLLQLWSSSCRTHQAMLEMPC